MFIYLFINLVTNKFYVLKKSSVTAYMQISLKENKSPIHHKNCTRNTLIFDYLILNLLFYYYLIKIILENDGLNCQVILSKIRKQIKKQVVSVQYVICPRQYFIMCGISLDNYYVYVVSHKNVYPRNEIIELFL